MENSEFTSFLRKKESQIPEKGLLVFDLYGTLIPNYGLAAMEQNTINFLHEAKKKGYILSIATSSKDEDIVKNILKGDNVEDLFSSVVTGQNSELHTERLMITIRKVRELTGKLFKVNEVFHFDDDYRRIMQSKSLGVKHIMVCDDENAKISIFGSDFLINNFSNSDQIFNFLEGKGVQKRKIKN
ncbi:MAG: HAD hydrolase-like protein [Candidatus Micrarchaeia archaeon]